MEKVIDFLHTLGHPYRKKAIQNCIHPNKMVDDKIDALEGAFRWRDSPEGFDYWNNYWNYLIDKNPQP